jgi:hypothetical protein
MSKIEVDAIEPQSGTTLTIGASGDSVNIASGATITDFTSTGIDDNATSTAITIDSSENVGIGETSPLGKLHVKTADSGATPITSGDEFVIEGGSGNIGMSFLSTGGNAQFIYFGDDADNNIGSIKYDHGDNHLQFITNASERMRIDSSGNLLVGRTDNPSAVSNSLYATGIYSVSGAASANVVVNSEGLLYRATSSLKYKNTIQNATHGLTELLNLRPVTFKGNNDGDKIFGGLIAEEVHEAGLTEFVDYDDEGNPDALHYSNMVSICIKAIQEQQTKIQELEARITTLETNNP